MASLLDMWDSGRCHGIGLTAFMTSEEELARDIVLQYMMRCFFGHIIKLY